MRTNYVGSTLKIIIDVSIYMSVGMYIAFGEVLHSGNWKAIYSPYKMCVIKELVMKAV